MIPMSDMAIAIHDTVSYYEMAERHIRLLKPTAILSMPVELNPVDEKVVFLNQLKKIPDNWDGYGGIAPKKATIKNAIDFLYSLPSAYQKMLNIDEVSITPYGTVVMEWYKNEDYYLSIEIGNSKIGFLSETPDGENPYKEYIELEPNAVSKEILPVFKKVFSA